ncbi:hypothetical protein IB265_24895 [Ensifer sp. ENS10]|uniref:hypothetical protein n=1 Tax=Ensifer sp. ENS10 TaxID=2769286 RepID=UPI00177C66CB|nr:hypothetical protein [Ensifer sp. ENS10]MBD9510016.1 hypothetical protein [Ensifer sp. ENS10]
MTKKRNWQAHRDEFQRERDKFAELLRHMDEYKIRHYRSVMGDPADEITDEIRADYKRAMESYEMLIGVVDEQIALGR